MNYDLSLIAAVLESRDLSEAMKSGLKPHMLSEEAKAYWDHIMVHVDQFHEVPTVDFFKGQIPQYEHHLPDNNIPALVHEVKTRYLHNELGNILQKAAESNQQDPWTAKNELLRLAESLSVEVQSGNTDLIAGEDKAQVLSQIKLLQGNFGLMGHAWPWDMLNKYSAGAIPGNFIYIYGREKSRKTFLALFLALFWEGLGLKVLFLTREMSREEIAWRLYCMRSNLPYEKFSKGEISTDGVHTVEMVMDQLFEHKNLIVSEVDGGIAGMRAKIEEVNPDIVIHDYLKALADDEMGDNLRAKENIYIAKVADRCKAIAMNPGKPGKKVVFVGVGHANRDGEKQKGKTTMDVANSDHIARKVDYAWRVVMDEPGNRMGVVITAGRSVRKYISWTLNANLTNGFGDLMAENADWIQQAEEVDDASEKNKESAKEKVEEAMRAYSKPVQRPANSRNFRR